MATNSVGSSQISPGAVGATQLGANVVGNGQLAPLSGPSELIGSNSSSPAASNITLGTGLMASNSIGSAQIIAGSVGATQLGANVVGTGQLAPLSANSELLGSNSSSPAATNITLGSGLSMTGSVLCQLMHLLQVPAATLVKSWYNPISRSINWISNRTNISYRISWSNTNCGRIGWSNTVRC